MSSAERKLKICHVITRMIVGGAQENTLLTLQGNLEQGHDVALATGPTHGPEGKLLSTMKLPEFPVREFPDLVRELSPLHDLKAFFALRDYFRKEKFDVIHTHTSKAGIIGRLAARAAGVPVVVHTVHGQAFHPYQSAWRNKLYIALERFAAKHCDRIYAVARAMIDQCVSAGVAPREKYQVVYSGMDTTAFANAVRETELREKLGLPHDAKTAVTVARLFPQKGYEYVLPAAAEVIRKHPEFHVLIVGDGVLYDSLRQQLAQMKILDHFHFAGLVPPSEVCRYLAQGDLLWHLSLHEGLPRAVVQALACGIPAVGFALDGTPEVVINGETGFTVPPEDFHQVADATNMLLEEPGNARRMGEIGRKRVLEQFDWHKMADILEKEYLRLRALKN